MRHLTAVLFLCSAFSAFAAPPPATAYTVDELVAKNIKAHGGLQPLQAIKTLKRSGKLLVNGGQIHIDYVQLQKRPLMVRGEASLQGLTQIQAHDGVEGWQINPFRGRKDPERTPPDDNKGLVEDADFDGPLVDWQAKKYQLEYAGTEDVDGTPALKIKVTKPGGDVLLIYLDPDYFLEIRTISQRKEHGVPVEIQSDFGDYEKINGVYFPFAVITGPKGAADPAKFLFDKAEANIAIDDAKFHFPAPTVKVGPVSPEKDSK